MGYSYRLSENTSARFGSNHRMPIFSKGKRDNDFF